MSDKMIYCRSCGKEIAKNAKVCPNCGAKNKRKSIFSIIGIVFIVIIIFGAIVGTSSGDSKDAPVDVDSTNVETKAASKDLEVENGIDGITIEKDMFTWYFKGTVINNKTRDLSYAQIEINLYDSDGALLGAAIDNVNNLKAGGKWKFKAMTLLSQEELNEVASWELGEVTGF